MNDIKVLLIIDSNDLNSNELNDSLIDNQFNVIKQHNIKKQLELSSSKLDFTLIICQFRNVKSVYLQAISEFIQDQPCPIILFTSDDSTDSINESVKAGVNAYIIDGFNSQRIKSIIEVAISRFNSFQSISKELKKTKQQLADRKLIDIAKGILMRNKNMDEQQAYQAIRKMAMDKGKNMSTIAQSLIDVIDVVY